MDEISKSVGTTSPESARRSNRKYAASENGKRHIKAKRRVEQLRRSGKLKPPAVCPKCGRNVKLDYHHTAGYDGSEGAKRTGVWRCRSCHSADDKQRHGSAMTRARRKAEATKKREGTYGLDGKKK